MGLALIPFRNKNDIQIGKRVFVTGYQIGNTRLSSLAGTIVSKEQQIGIKFDEKIGGHNCSSFDEKNDCKSGYGWYYPYDCFLGSNGSNKIMEVITHNEEEELE